VASLPITLACGRYDRTQALADGRVRIDGVDLRYVHLEPEEIFFRMLTYEEFDVSEMSLSTYLLTHMADGPFVAIPVFPSRMFRHNSVYVNEDSCDPAADAAGQLVGKTVGLAEYQLTANVWLRGILAEHHGVPVASVRYRTGGLNSPGRHEKFEVKLPPEVDIEPVPAGRTLSEMLASGALDAVYTPRAPASFGTGPVRRLFADSRGEEERYFTRTGVFPIMHVVVIHRRVYEANRWIARELMKAFDAAKKLAYEELSKTVSLSITLPFIREEYERTLATMGGDYWPYGLSDNADVLSTFIRYAHEQGLVDRAPEPEELFAPEAGKHFVI
jgi:4,5-dihydroxyphthalate decarboxylase